MHCMVKKTQDNRFERPFFDGYHTILHFRMSRTKEPTPVTDQEFLASFAAEIDESAYSEENRDLAGEAASAFEASTA